MLLASTDGANCNSGTDGEVYEKEFLPHTFHKDGRVGVNRLREKCFKGPGPGNYKRPEGRGPDFWFEKRAQELKAISHALYPERNVGQITKLPFTIFFFRRRS